MYKVKFNETEFLELIYFYFKNRSINNNHIASTDYDESYKRTMTKQLDSIENMIDNAKQDIISLNEQLKNCTDQIKKQSLQAEKLEKNKLENFFNELNQYLKNISHPPIPSTKIEFVLQDVKWDKEDIPEWDYSNCYFTGENYYKNLYITIYKMICKGVHING